MVILIIKKINLTPLIKKRFSVVFLRTIKTIWAIAPQPITDSRAPLTQIYKIHAFPARTLPTNCN